MITTDSMPAKATRYACERCNMSGPRPIVVPIANPKRPESGRCSNKTACEKRQLREKNRAKQSINRRA
jgi:hypothetical protein